MTEEEVKEEDDMDGELRAANTMRDKIEKSMEKRLE